MAAISDYLETNLVNHIFRGSEFLKPTNISIALTSDVAKDNQTGATIPEIPTSVTVGNSNLTTNYSRFTLGNPAEAGNESWSEVGVDNLTAYQVFLESPQPYEFAINSNAPDYNTFQGSGYYYPLFLNKARANNEDNNGLSYGFKFKDFPGVELFSPRSSVSSGVPQDGGLLAYEGNGFIKNNGQIIFEPAFRDWGFVSGIAILDSPNAGEGNLLMYSQLRNPRYIYTGDQIKFDSKSLEISLT